MRQSTNCKLCIWSSGYLLVFSELVWVWRTEITSLDTEYRYPLFACGLLQNIKINDKFPQMVHKCCLLQFIGRILSINAYWSIMLPTRIMISAGRWSKTEAKNRAARGRFSMGNLDWERQSRFRSQYYSLFFILTHPDTSWHMIF